MLGLDAETVCLTLIVTGEDTGNQASTFYESKYAVDRKKQIILLRMIPFGQDFENLQARVMFGMNKMTLYWELGQPMPADLVGAIVKAVQEGSR